MLCITVEGSPFERGVQHGRQFREQIAQTVATYCPGGWQTSSDVQELKLRLLTSLSQLFPDALVEMTGIAEGAAMEFEKIALLNLVAATNDLGYEQTAAGFRFACTAVGMDETDVGPLVAKNCDERKSAAPFYLFKRVMPAGRQAFMGISWLGTVWMEAAINENGLGLMQTAGPVFPGQDGFGLACNIVPRFLAERCETVNSALALLAGTRVAGWGMGLVLGDLSGNVVVAEKGYDRLAVLPSKHGFAGCTNHFVSVEMMEARAIPHEGLLDNSRVRARTIESLVVDGHWPRTLRGMQSLLGYHGEHGFVCQHGDADMDTNYSCIALLRDRKMLLCDGHPCEGRYRELTLH